MRNMSIAPDMRDGRTATEVSETEDAVLKLRERVIGWRDEAAAEGALAHAGLYEACAAQLTAARKDLARAWAILANGDPEDFDYYTEGELT